jgi:hypothetical protein
MTLSEDTGPTFSGSGSPGPLGRWVRKKTLVAALAVAAAAGGIGLVQANTASAAMVGTVYVQVSIADANNWGAGWGEAWNRCRTIAPQTQHVEYWYSEYHYPENSSTPDGATQAWKCFDTP